MANRKKPLVVVTRKLPERVETRMRELFDARLNLDDKPMSQAELAEAVEDRRRAGADGHRPDRRRGARPRPATAQADRQFRQRRRQYRRRRRRQRGITVTNTPGVLTEDTADMTMALILAVPRRLAEGAAVLTDERKWTGWSPTWMLGHRIGGKRLGIIGMGRIGQAVARRARAFGLQIHYHNRRRVRAAHRGGTGRDLLGEPRPDARPHGHHLGQLPAHAGDLSSAVGAAAQADAARRLHRQHRARRGDRRERAGAPDLAAGEIAGAGLDVFEHEPAVNPKLLRLARAGKVVLLPHMGSATLEGRIDMGEKVIVNIKSFLDGHKPPDRVLPSML